MAAPLCCSHFNHLSTSISWWTRFSGDVAGSIAFARSDRWAIRTCATRPTRTLLVCLKPQNKHSGRAPRRAFIQFRPTRVCTTTTAADVVLGSEPRGKTRFVWSGCRARPAECFVFLCSVGSWRPQTFRSTLNVRIWTRTIYWNALEAGSLRSSRKTLGTQTDRNPYTCLIYTPVMRFGRSFSFFFFHIYSVRFVICLSWNRHPRRCANTRTKMTRPKPWATRRSNSIIIIIIENHVKSIIWIFFSRESFVGFNKTRSRNDKRICVVGNPGRSIISYQTNWSW